MPRLRMEVEDKIVELIDQEYKNSEISRKLGIHRTTIANRRKARFNQKQEQEKTDTKKSETARSRPLQMSALEKRINKVERTQRKENISFNTSLLKRIKILEKSQQGSNPSLLEKRIKKLEEMGSELLESAERRLTDEDACKQVNKNGFCLLYYYSEDEVEKSEFFKPRGTTTQNGKKVYHINVREHPIVCSACPDYERRG